METPFSSRNFKSRSFKEPTVEIRSDVTINEYQEEVFTTWVRLGEWNERRSASTLMMYCYSCWWSVSAQRRWISAIRTPTHPQESQRSHVPVCYAPCGRNSTVNVIQCRRNGPLSSGDKNPFRQLSQHSRFHVVYFYTTFKKCLRGLKIEGYF